MFEDFNKLVESSLARLLLDMTNESFGSSLDRVSFGSGHFSQHDSVRVRFRVGRVDFESTDFWFNRLFLKRKMI